MAITKITGSVIQANTISAAAIANNAIQARHIADGAISIADIAVVAADRALKTNSDGELVVSDVTSAELDVLDGITASTAELNFNDLGSSSAGTVVASKAVTVDANKDVGSFRNLTATGLLTTSSIVIGDGSTIGSTSDTDALNIASDGSLGVTSTTTSSSTTTGALKVAGGIGVAGDIFVGDDIELKSDSARLTFGSDSEIRLEHNADAGLIIKHTATGDDKPVSLTLQTGETDITVNEVLGKIDFQAPDEAGGTDAILVAAGIEAVSEGTFAADNNATKLVFKTAASEAASEKMSLSSAGLLTISDDLIIGDGKTIGSASDPDAITIASGGAVTFSQDVVITGGLQVDGTTTTVNSTTVTVDDPIFTLGGDSAPGSDDNKDRGIEFRYHTGSAAKVGFFGFDDSTGKFTFIPDATNSSEVFSGTTGGIDVNSVTVNGLTASRALQTDSSKNLESSSVTTTELGHLSGVTSGIQSQLNTLTAREAFVFFSNTNTSTSTSNVFFIGKEVHNIANVLTVSIDGIVQSAGATKDYVFHNANDTIQITDASLPAGLLVNITVAGAGT
jgi:hypothetical protein